MSDGLRRIRWITSVALALALAWSTAAWAAPSCTFVSVLGVNFGTYDVFDSVNDDSTGWIVINCTGNPNHWSLTLGKGANSTTFIPRKMVNAGTLLNYNLYTDATRTIVWGDGTGGTVTVPGAGNGTTRLPVYGRIPPGQDARAGINTDIVVITLNF